MKQEYSPFENDENENAKKDENISSEPIRYELDKNCVDFLKLKRCFHNLPEYQGRSAALESKFDESALKLPLNEELLKHMTRMGIPET